MQNARPEPVALFQVDGDCLEQLHQELEPGEETVYTPSEHTAWTVRDPESAELLQRIEIPGPEDVVVVVEP